MRVVLAVWVCLQFCVSLPAQEDSPGPEAYRADAEQGEAEAQFQLGLCYYRGKGVEEDDVRALEWFRKAAAQGHGDASLHIGICFYYGYGVEENNDQAVEWFRKGAKAEVPNAYFYLGHCHYFGYGVAEDNEQAVAWFRKAAEVEVPAAHYYLGICFENGYGVEADLAEAFAAFQAAALLEYAAAQNILGIYYEKGYGVAADPKKAVEWYRRAADQEHAAAFDNLGLCYLEGVGVEQDRAKGLELIHRSAEMGSAVAQRRLGEFYLDGNYVEADEEHGLKWLRLAAEQTNEDARDRLRADYPGQHLDVVDGTFDLRIFAEIDRPMLVTVQRKAVGSFVYDPEHGESEAEFNFESQESYVETFTRLGATEWTAIRQYGEVRSTTNGAISDNELNGMGMTLEVEDGQVQINMLEDRLIRKVLLNDLIRDFDSTGFVLPLPSKVRVGDELQVDLVSLGPFLLDSKTTSAVGKLKFAEFDVEAGLALLEGTGEFEFVSEDGGGQVEGTATLECRLAVSLRESRLAYMHAKGLAEGVGRTGGRRGRAELQQDIEIRTVYGAAAEEALKSKVRYRTYPRPVPEVGVHLELPSYWFQTKEKDETMFAASLKGKGIIVALQSFELGGLDHRHAIESAAEQVLKEYPDGKVRPVSHSLGRGRSVTFSNDGKDFRVDLLPLDSKRLLRIRCFGEPDAFRAARKEYAKLLKTVRPLD